MKRSLIVVALLVSFARAGAQDTKRADDALIGMWGTELFIGPTLRGPITIANDGRTWRAIVDRLLNGFRRIRQAIAGGVHETRSFRFRCAPRAGVVYPLRQVGRRRRLREGQ